MDETNGVQVGGALMLKDKNIVENALAADCFTTLIAAVKAAGLVDTLAGAGPFTVFAPDDAAFKKLAAGTVESLLLPENKEKLVSILKYHVVSGAVHAADLTDGEQKVQTLEGSGITVNKTSDGVLVNGAKVTTADVISSNGVIHVINAVLMPE